MKDVKYLALLSTLALLFPVSLFARDKNQHTVDSSDSFQVGSMHLKAGEYQVEWQGEGPAVQVKFLKNGALMATVPATVKLNDPQVTQDDVVVRTTTANNKVLEEIDFAHHKEAVILKKG